MWGSDGMSELMELQRQFQDYLFQSSQEIQHHILGTRRVPAETRLGIYGNAYRLRLLEALSANYPVLRQCLGDDLFDRLGFDFIHTSPSSYRSIRWYGDAFKSFLSADLEISDYPWALELTDFEWALSLVFDAADAMPMSLDDIARVPPETWADMCFQMHPSVLRLNFHWNVVPLWQACDAAEPLPQIVSMEKPQAWVLWRKDYLNQFCSLSETEAWAIDALLKGASFGSLCEDLFERTDDENSAFQIASFLKGWVHAGLIIGIC
jgi:hypothetical protein